MRRLWLALLATFLAPFLALVLAAGGAQAQDVQPVPPLSGRVIDQTATLQPAQREALEAKLAAFEAKSGPQIVLLLVPGTAPEDIAAYAQRVAEQWKIGRREVGDGVLVVVAKDERKLRIEVAKALEGAIPDLAARQIIDQAMRPAFRAGDYAGGLNQAVDRLVARIEGEGLPAPVAGARDGAGAGLQLEELGLFFFVGVPVIAAVFTGLFGRKLGALLTGGAAGGLGWWFTASVAIGIAAGVLTLVVVGLFGIGSAVQRMGRSGRVSTGPGWPHGRQGGVHDGSWGGGWGGGSFGGGSSDGGGGFSSGGGGDFGGGGASGDW